MYKIILLIVLLTIFIDLTISSQTYEYVKFPDSNAIWSEMYYPPVLSGDDPVYQRFGLSGEDTLINNLSYKKIYQFQDTLLEVKQAIYVGGIREDQNKVIYFIGSPIHWLKPSYTQILNNGGTENDEVILYDFSLNEGDTFKYGNLSLYDQFLTVTNIDTLEINNSKRKIYYFDPIWWVQWIEGIGNVKGLLFTSGDLPTNGLDNDLICFKHNDIIEYFNDDYGDCIPTSINSSSPTELIIRVSPNPCYNAILTFCFPGLDFKRLEIFNVNGHSIDNFILNLQDEITIDTKSYAPGIYFFLVTKGKGKSVTGKFVILKD